MNLALSTTLETSFEDAVARTRAALQEQGFGVLTEIDMQATMKAKLDVDMERYLILGACNPPLAHRAVEVDRQSPAEEGTVLVEAMNPELLVQVTGEPALAAVADEAGRRLQAAIDALTAD